MFGRSGDRSWQGPEGCRQNRVTSVVEHENYRTYTNTHLIYTVVVANDDLAYGWLKFSRPVPCSHLHQDTLKSPTCHPLVPKGDATTGSAHVPNTHIGRWRPDAFLSRLVLDSSRDEVVRCVAVHARNKRGQDGPVVDTWTPCPWTSLPGAGGPCAPVASSARPSRKGLRVSVFVRCVRGSSDVL